VTTLPNPIADPAECRAFLDANPDVQFFEVIFTALSGVPRGKRLRRHEIMAVFEYGRFLPGSILVCDVTGQDCEDLRTGSACGEG
jgi:glutamine synthetase